MKRDLLTALKALLLLSLVTGVLYPMLVTAFAQTLFPHEANGSLIERNGRVIGSELLGQAFARPEHFKGRPSATADFPYHVLASAGSNLGPTNPVLHTALAERARFWRDRDDSKTAVPVDLVTASASGLDPDISVAAALYQVPRVAQACGLDVERVRELVLANAKGNEYRAFSVARVNVLQLNLALDGMKRSEP